MPRKKTSSSTRRPGRSGKGGGGSSAMKYLLIGGGIVVIGLIIWLIVAVLIDNHKFNREYLDKYVEMTAEREAPLGEGAGVYVDMSDGMNYAYASDDSRKALQHVINKLAAIKGVDFFRLADGEITPLEMNHTSLYNYMLNPSSYTQQQAPIEKAIDQIIAQNKPALLMTDFEEYNNGVIQRAAYAKRGFIEWLSKGYNITFYKWDFEEKGKEKSMFLAVFDDNLNRLNSSVAQAIAGDDDIDMFVLGSRLFAYAMKTGYEKINMGGGYHNENGEDLVTGIREDGDDNSYHSYHNPVASATDSHKFATLDNSIGEAAAFYPLGVSWKNAYSNAQKMTEEGIEPKNQFSHLFSKLYVNFGSQDGYIINGVEIRAFDIQNAVSKIEEDPEIKSVTVAGMDSKELSDFLSVQLVPTTLDGYSELLIDFHRNFAGDLTGLDKTDDLIRANIVISHASINEEGVRDFFAWPGNDSLAESVRNALQAPTTNPVGRVIYTYYFKAAESK